MRRAAAWSVRGVERETHAIAQEAARRAGMSLGDWLDEVVAEEAADEGVSAEDWDDDDKLEAISSRLSRLSRREDGAAGAYQRDVSEGPRTTRAVTNASGEETRRAQHRLEAAIAKFETRAAKNEERTAKALESVANWIEKSQTDRAGERATLQSVAEKLAVLEQLSARDAELPAAATLKAKSRIEEVEAKSDSRFGEFPRRDTVLEPSAGKGPPAGGRPEIDVRDPVDRTAHRQAQPDAQRTASNESLAPKTAWRSFGVAPAPARSSAPGSKPLTAAAPASKGGVSADPLVEALRAEIATLSARLERIRAVHAERRPSPKDADDLRAELASMTRSVAGLAPRNGAVALEGAMGDLGRRLDAARKAGASDKLVAPVEEMLRQVLATLREHDPHSAVERLERELRAMGAKIEALTHASVKPEILDRIRGQTEEVRELLAIASSSSINVERLERQIGDLADRVERLVTSPTPHAETERVVQLLSETRSQIERSTPAPVLAAIERRLEQLAARMDEAIRRPPPTPKIDARPLEDLARRIEGVRASIDRQTEARPDAARLEAALRDINRKLDEPPVSAGESTVLIETLQKLTARLEEAVHRPMPPSALDGVATEELARRIEGIRAALERQADFRPHVAKLEAALGDINSKLDQPPASAADSTALTETLQNLASRLEEVVRHPTPSSALDAIAIEDLARRIEGMRAALERQGDFRPHVVKLEAALGDISSKLDRAPIADRESTALTTTLRDLTNRLDEAFRRPPPSVSVAVEPFENLAQRIDDVRATVERQVDSRADGPKLAAALSEINVKLDRQTPSAEETGLLVKVIQELAARIDRGFKPAPDTRRLESLIHELGEKFATSTTPISYDTGPIERLLSQVYAKLDEVAGLAIDARPLELAIRELHEKLDFRDQPQIDSRLVEQAADLLANRMEQRDGAAADAEALVDQLSQIHGRLDSLNIAPASIAAIERTVSELLEEVEAMRQALQTPLQSAAPSAALIGDIAEIRADQASASRRIAARLTEIQDVLEKVVSRLGRIEDETARRDDGSSEPRSPGAYFSAASKTNDKPAVANANNVVLRNIPDRAPAAPASGGETAARAIERSNGLLEPGASAPQRTLGDDRGSPSSTKNSGLNSHIAAARRAAQAALVESANKKIRNNPASRPGDSDEDSSASAIEQAQAFLTARRRPILLGAAFLGIATTLAVYELRDGRPHASQKSQLSDSIQSPAPAAPSGEAHAPEKTAGPVDYSPVGNVAPTKPTNQRSGSFTAAPADIIAVIPAGIPENLRAAASAGDPGAETELALRYLEGRTLARDPKTAARWFELAAVQGAPVAQYRLAALYEKGIGVARDAALARSWYLKAANAGNARAMHNLAVLIAGDADAGRPDYAEAGHWFRRAGELGVRDSQFNLGVLYGRGLGVPQDLGQSWLWFSLAAQQGDADAAKKRDEVAAKLDAKALAAASAALSQFRTQTPRPEANEAPVPAGGWDGRANAPQADHPSPPVPNGAGAPGAHG